MIKVVSPMLLGRKVDCVLIYCTYNSGQQLARLMHEDLWTHLRPILSDGSNGIASVIM